ncbi:MAG: DNA-binding response OmpR family regulator [Planctomycetota bacterium]|jgi:DNA-binding response OmpR family regulator|tara:strand:- start:7135 stop:7797 length:663 start_codon:yes stop_codon:yes gene_type:complete
MKILLVENDLLLGESVVAAMQLGGYVIDWVKDGVSAVSALQTTLIYDLVLLDIGLPDISGLDVLKKARSHGLDVPVLILTARDAVADRVAGLDAGADDYVIKPFDMKEVFARIRSLDRRLKGRPSDELIVGDLVLQPSNHEILYCGEELVLTKNEFNVLQTLIERAGRPVLKSYLEESLYAWGSEICSNAVEVYIHRLRKKIGKENIKTIHGIGYKMEAK